MGRESGGPLSALREKGAELLGRRSESGLVLLRDIRELHLLAAEASIDWTMLGQAAQAQKDEEDKETAWKTELKTLEETVKNGDLAGQKKSWEEREAYLADAYRLGANRQLCLQCHQVGKQLPNQKLTEGPPLASAQ